MFLHSMLINCFVITYTLLRRYVMTNEIIVNVLKTRIQKLFSLLIDHFRRHKLLIL